MINPWHCEERILLGSCVPLNESTGEHQMMVPAVQLLVGQEFVAVTSGRNIHSFV